MFIQRVCRSFLTVILKTGLKKYRMKIRSGKTVESGCRKTPSENAGENGCLKTPSENAGENGRLKMPSENAVADRGAPVFHALSRGSSAVPVREARYASRSCLRRSNQSVTAYLEYL